MNWNTDHKQFIQSLWLEDYVEHFKLDQVDYKIGNIPGNRMFQCEINKLAIHNISFLSGFTFEHCTFEELNIYNMLGKPITFKNCKIKTLKLGYIEDENVVIHYNSIDSIAIEDSTVEDVCIIAYLEIRNGLRISNSKFKDLQIGNLKCDFLTLFNTSVGAEFLIQNCELERIDIGGFYESVSILDITSLKNFIVAKASAEIFEVKQCKEIVLFAIDVLDAEFFNIEDCILQTFRITRAKLDTLKLTRTNFANISMVGLDEQSFAIRTFILDATACDPLPTCHIKNLNIKTFKLIGYRNTGSFLLENLVCQEEFAIKFSRLTNKGTAEFRSVDLQECKRVSFFDTNLLESEFYNVRWHTTYTLNELDYLTGATTKSQKVNRYWLLKESYRQLKIIALGNNDKIEANFFQKGELNAYYHILRLKRHARYWGDLIILWVSKVLGGYGLNIWRPIIAWGILHTVLFFAILHVANYPFKNPAVYWKDIDFMQTKKAIGLYINLLSPVHDGTLYGRKIIGILDATIRVVGGLFIYYIIRASRKFIFNN